MNDNSNLHKAKREANNEFYTQLKDIENELQHYKKHFKGKVVYCNCDTDKSNFTKYFTDNFTQLGLKELITTSLDDGIDFRSKESIELLERADIVVTNPPFSLFREYIAQLMEYDKKFLVVGPLMQSWTSGIFPFIKEKKIWLGATTPKKYEVPEYYTGKKYEKDGQWWSNHGNHCWFTNLDFPKRHEKLILFKNYTEEEYPTYDNYKAVECGKVKIIPSDYFGVMGVPISFLLKDNGKQFEVLGVAYSADRSDVTNSLRTHTKNRHTPSIKGKFKQPRLLIKRKAVMNMKIEYYKDVVEENKNNKAVEEWVNLYLEDEAGEPDRKILNENGEVLILGFPTEINNTQVIADITVTLKGK